jgi:hypothetical protein
MAGLTAIACTVTWDAEVIAPASTGTAIENAHLRVALDAHGALTLTDKATGVTTEKFLGVLSELDAGDSYNFSPPLQNQISLQQQFSLVRVVQHQHVQELVVAIAMSVPARLREDRMTGSEAKVSNHGQLRMRLFAGGRALECELTWHNAAFDQRTRLVMPISAEATASDSACSWQARAVTLAQYPGEISRREMPPVVLPSLSAIVAGRLAFAHRAMQEYEVLAHNHQRYLGVTMVRSVGWMSRRDLVTRGAGAGPDMETPEAQCVGEAVFTFRVGVLDGQFESELDHTAWLNGGVRAWR